MPASSPTPGHDRSDTPGQRRFGDAERAPGTSIPYRGRVGRASRSFDGQLEVVPVDLDLA